MQQSNTFEAVGAAEMAAAVRAGAVSALELAEAAIARIEARDGPINAVVVRDFDRGREQARAVDRAVADGADMPLAGVPMTVKESFNVAGLPTSFGLEFARDYRPSEDADAVKRLKAAGAVILGKSNVPVSLSDYQSDNPIYGRTSNPHDLNRSPGGSSGGSAAALAAGMVPLELGSDAGGSIRIPSAFCGVFGHLPSVGVISLEGFGPPGGGMTVPASVRTWAAAGPMAMNAEDLALALGVLGAPETRDATGWRLALPPARHKALADYRVFVLTDHPSASVESEIVEAIDALAANLERSGARVSRKSELLPSQAQSQALVERFADVARAMKPAGEGPPPPTIKDYVEALMEQEAIRRRWDAFFRDFDVVISPAYATVAFPHFPEPDPWPGLNRKLRIDGREVPYGPQHAWPLYAGMARLPATTAPIGRTRSGLPIGAQFIGPFLEDLTTIGFVGLASEAFGLKAEIARPTG